MNPATPSNPPAVTLFGGEQITVRFRGPKGAEAVSEVVTVREVKPSEMGKYLAAVHSMTGLVELVCDKPAGWGDILAPKSLLEVCDKAKELNDPFFVEWVKRQGPELRRMAEAMGTAPRG